MLGVGEGHDAEPASDEGPGARGDNGPGGRDGDEGVDEGAGAGDLDGVAAMLYR